MTAVALLRRAASITLSTALGLAACVLLLYAVGAVTGAYEPRLVLSGSMQPALPMGSIAVDRGKPASALRAGELLTYREPLADHALVTHRVVRILHDADGALLVTTRGDANPTSDPWTTRIPAESSVQTVRLRLPYAGYPLVWAHRLLARRSVLLVLGLVAFLLVVPPLPRHARAA